MKTCFVSIDVEHDFTLPSHSREIKQFQGIKNLDKILDVFKKGGVSATLFITGEVLEKYSDKVKKWAEDYEIASHGFSHKFWNTLNVDERRKELRGYEKLYENVFDGMPNGFRSPSHLIDEQAIELLRYQGYLYDSSVVPHYPFFKKYRGYKKRAPLSPYYPSVDDCRKQGNVNILEIPTTGQIFGIPLAGAWIAKLPIWFYEILFKISCPHFITLSCHSWDILKPSFLEKLEAILILLEKKDYKFLNGIQVFNEYKKV